MASSNAPSTGVSYTELLTMFCEMMQQLRLPIRREIPSINKISKEEDFPVWQGNLIYMLNQFDLTKFINSNVPEPAETAACVTWAEDRTAVDNYTSVPTLGTTRSFVAWRI